MAKGITDEQVVAAYRTHGSRKKAAEVLGLDRRGYARRLNRLLDASTAQEAPDERLHRDLMILRSRLQVAEQASLDEERVKREIFRLSDIVPPEPDWLVDPGASPAHGPGVPVLFLSDWHVGEVVEPSEVGGTNRYNMDIAEERARLLTERTIQLLTRHMVSPQYPGIVVVLGGDMVSGNLHEELLASNEAGIMVQVERAAGLLLRVLKDLAGVFDRVLVVAVSGNHGRTSRKPYAKRRNYSNFDWLISRVLQMSLQDDDRFRWHVADGAEAHFRIYNHRYNVEHGDAFRGGDGFIGPVGVAIRGDARTRQRDHAVNRGYETLLLGHFHQYMQIGERLIINGSLKGVDEYAWRGKFGFEPPQQALWITHWDRGITFSMPIRLDESPRHKQPVDWVSWR